MNSRRQAASLLLLTLVGVSAACSTGEPDDQSDGASQSPLDRSTSTPSGPEPEDTQASSASPSAALARPTPSPTRTVDLVWEEVDTSLELPREVVDAGDGRVLVTDQHGTVIVLEDGVEREEPFLTLDGVISPSGNRQELGLVGFALAPDHAETGTFYTYVTRVPGEDDPAGTQRVDVLSRWTADVEDLTVDPDSEVVLLEHPTTSVTHVGDLAVDDAGLLYASFGSTRTDASAQDPNVLAGKILRIDPRAPEDGREYSIPPDNPQVDGERPEVWSMGYRNAWRLEWDTDLGLLAGEAMAREKPQMVHQPQAGSNAGYPDLAGPCWSPAGEVMEACLRTDSGAEVLPPSLEYPASVGTILSGVEVIDGALGGDGTGVLVSDWNGSLLLADPSTMPWRWTELITEEDAPWGRDEVWDLETDDEGVLYVGTAPVDAAGGQLWTARLDSIVE